MSDVVNKETFQVLRSVHTPEYPKTEWVRNPLNLDALIGSGTDDEPEVPKIYWVVDPPSSQNLREMTQEEKDLIEMDPVLLEELRTEQKNVVRETTRIFLASRYSEELQRELINLGASATNGQVAILEPYFDWVQDVFLAQNDVFTQIDEESSVTEIQSLGVDYDPLIASDPGLALSDILDEAGGPKTGSGVSAFEEAESTTTGTDFSTKVTTNPTFLQGGTYLLRCSYGWKCSRNNQAIEVRIQEDSGSGFETVAEVHRQEVKDIETLLGPDTYYLNRIFQRSLPTGTYRWRVQYRSSQKKVEVSIWEVYLDVKAV